MAIISISGKINSGKDLLGQIIQYLTSTEYKRIGDAYSYASFLVDIRIDNNEDSKSEWQIKKFADKLKQIVSILTGIPVEDLESQEVKNRVLGEEWWKFDETTIKNWLLNSYSKKEIDEDKSIFLNNYKNSPKGIEKPTVRELLQTLGTDLLREQLHPNIFINALFADYEINDKLIITDLRFLNEKKAIEDRDGITIRINRDTELRFPKLWEEFHSSEFDAWDDFLKNVKQFDKVYHESETDLDFVKFNYTIDNNSSVDSLIEKVKEILTKEKII